MGAPPIIINKTILTLEHVMQRLDVIEKKMVTLEQVENLDKKMQNLANKFGSKGGDVFKLLRKKETIINKRIGESPSRIDKLEEFFSNLSSAFSSAKTIENRP